MRCCDTVTALCRFTAHVDFMPSSSFRTTSDGTPRMVEVTGATVTVDKYAMALLRVSTRAGRFLSFVLAPAANWYSRTSPRAILPATQPPIPNPALRRPLANVASSPGGRALHWLAVPTGGDVPAGRRAPRRNGFAECASRLGRRHITAFYPARFERFAYVESTPQYTPHRRHFTGGWPTRARFWLEWGSSSPGQSLPASSWHARSAI